MNSKPNFSFIIIVLLTLVIILQRTCSKSVKIADDKITIKTDTVWKHTHDTVFQDVKIIEKVFVDSENVNHYPGETIDTCKARFQNLLKEHLVRTVYSDTLKLDSLGTIVVRDTVWINKLYGKRSYTKNYKIPQVTKTITITKQQEPKKQMYEGQNAFPNRKDITEFSPRLIYNKK